MLVFYAAHVRHVLRVGDTRLRLLLHSLNVGFHEGLLRRSGNLERQVKADRVDTIVAVAGGSKQVDAGTAKCSPHTAQAAAHQGPTPMRLSRCREDR